MKTIPLMRFTVACLVMIVTGAHAGPVIVAWVGPTVGSQKYLNVLGQGHDYFKQHHKPSFVLPPPSNETEHLTPGYVAKQTIKVSHRTIPLFIVGADRASLRWLSLNKTYLKKIHAIGFMVNASLKETVAVMHQFGLVLVPAKPVFLTRHYHLHHYPVLMTQHVIKQ